MTSEFSLLLKKYSIPVLLVIAGLTMLIIGITGNQNGMFKVASILMLAAAGISFLYSSGSFKPKLLFLIGIVSGVAAIITLFVSYKSVKDTNTYNNNYAQCKLLAKQNLEDIRYIQKVHAEQNGVYLSDWDALIEFTKSAQVPWIDAQGIVPDRKITEDERDYLYTGKPPIDNNMTEEEAYRLSLWTEGPLWQEFKDFKRDTSSVNLIDFKFGNKSYIESREKQGFYPFSADSLPIIPFTNERWTIETVDSLPMGEGISGPAIKISGMIPFAKTEGKNNDQEAMYFGSITTFALDGSWESE